MRKLASISMLVVLVAVPSLVTAGEKDVLKALERIKGAVEAGVNLERYSELVADAKVELNIYERSKEVNEDFLKEAELCYEDYQQARKAWSLKLPQPGLGAPPLAIKVQLDDKMQELWKSAADHLEQAYKAL